jgi:tetratricopeptide (TPR) repeat protein
MLETIREFAAERLQVAGETESARAAHAAYILGLAEASEPWLRGREQRAWLDRIEAEIDNLRAALRWFRDRGDAERGMRFAGALQWFWWDRGYLREGQEWLTTFLALAGAEAVALGVRARALHGASYLASSCGEYDAAMALSEESLRLDRGDGDEERVAWALAYLAVAKYRSGDVGAARVIGEQSLAIFRRLQIPEGISFAIGYVGLAAQDQGDDAAAMPLLDEGVRLGHELGDRDNLSRALLGLGFMALYNLGDIATARERFSESLAVAVELGHPYPLIYSLEGLAGVAATEGRPRRALRLAGAAGALRETHHAVPAPQLLDKHRRFLALAAATLPEERRAADLAEGRAMPVARAIAYARTDAD